MIAHRWSLASERCFMLSFDGAVSLDKQELCWGLAEDLLHADFAPYLVETVVGMNTLSVYTIPLTVAQMTALEEALTAFSQTMRPKKIAGNHVQIPVRYGGRYGADLADCANAKGMSKEALVAAHTAPIYTVYFIGFQAGFPYLGGLPEALFMARHSVPRTQVPAGSVGIGGQQTGIYPFASPGGWQLLGQTTAQLFDVQQNPPTLLKAGDTLQFVALSVD